MATESVYHDTILPPRSKSTRVLNIVAASTFEEPIRASLEVINLDKKPAFTALSYAWGIDPPTTQHFIICNGSEVKVTSNCESALKHLRRAFGSLTIWVDIICINQEDVTEKSHQIPLMADIYSSASSVYCWLGKGTVKSDEAMDYMANNKLYDHFTGTESDPGPHPWRALWRIFLRVLWPNSSETYTHLVRKLIFSLSRHS
ncbi:heterokaryon incompatibility protein-domain-containing protein [Dendryphion nanum]|uniref:Heterokaryon incompatibility protein-domain-containing protein n=1 Tax=Dendryphion nanum TaxID=256645 RepID=A0A9P9DEM6_9PLEO|nr:heterokaryon incompatibility protein-domain-containing protein [Dendryphion nanum]